MVTRLIGTPVPESSELQELIQKFKGHQLSPRELWLQRVSFTYGQLAIGNPNLTKKHIEQEAIRTYGPCPEA